jgi:AraC-like DNA-binding protein
MCRSRFIAVMTSSKRVAGRVGVNRVLRLIRKRAHLPITVAHLTRASGMSRRGLHKAFIRHTGKRPGAALREFRMKLARRLLRRSRSSIPVVSARCGYPRPNSFYIAFRRFSGVSPGRFRDYPPFSSKPGTDKSQDNQHVGKESISPEPIAASAPAPSRATTGARSGAGNTPGRPRRCASKCVLVRS